MQTDHTITRKKKVHDPNGINIEQQKKRRAGWQLRLRPAVPRESRLLHGYMSVCSTDGNAATHRWSKATTLLTRKARRLRRVRRTCDNTSHFHGISSSLSSFFNSCHISFLGISLCLSSPAPPLHFYLIFFLFPGSFFVVIQPTAIEDATNFTLATIRWPSGTACPSIPFRSRYPDAAFLCSPSLFRIRDALELSL